MRGTCIITDDHYGKAAPQEAAIEAKLAELVLPLRRGAARSPVMGGFIGSTADGITTTLGRGGSDYTAALVGGGLHAGAIEIWTDVNGIMTTDPRICADALRVKTISFEEAAELAYFGAKVLHPATILPAVQKSIPVWVLNSRNAENEGTQDHRDGAALRESVQEHRREEAADHHRRRRQPDADVARLSEGGLRRLRQVPLRDRHGLDQRGLHLASPWTRTSGCRRSARSWSKIADVKLEGHKALICMVGEDIRGHNGIAGRVFSAISHVNVRMISQGASEINMSFMIEEADVEEAVRALHTRVLRRRPTRRSSISKRGRCDAPRA